MKDPKVFNVTAIESFKAVGDEDIKKPVIHLYNESRIGDNAAAVSFEVKRDLTKGMKGDAVQDFFNRLGMDIKEVKVEAVNFQG